MSDEVEYLVPLKSMMLVTAVKVPIVDEGDRNSVEDARPVGPMVKKIRPVDEATVRRFAVWFVAPMILRVVDPTLDPWRKTSEVPVTLGATAKDDPPKSALPVAWRRATVRAVEPEAFEKLNRVATSRLVEETLPSVFSPAFDWNVPPTVRLPVEEAAVKLNRVATSRLVPEAFAKVSWFVIWVLAPVMVRLPVPEAATKLNRVATSRLVEETLPSVFSPAFDWKVPPTVKFWEDDADVKVSPVMVVVPRVEVLAVT